MKHKSLYLISTIVFCIVQCYPYLSNAQNNWTEQIAEFPTQPYTTPQASYSHRRQIPSTRSNVNELIEIDNQITDTRTQLRSLTTFIGLIRLFLRTETQMNDAFDHAQGIKCDVNAVKLQTDFSTTEMVFGNYRLLQEAAISDGVLLKIPEWVAQYSGNGGGTGKCEFLKNEQIYPKVISTYEHLKKLLTDKIDERNSLTDKLSTLMANRADALASSNMAIKSVTGSLPWMVGFIAAFALGAIWVVSRYYKGDAQMEWVASGQVTQFVTVMILLTALMALGLTNILGEQVLGTLLGGVAGYVLAQGVGKSAARSIHNAAVAAAPQGGVVSQADRAVEGG